MVDGSISAAWQFAFVIGPVNEVWILVTLEVTFVVDLKSLSIIRWHVILPMWCFLACLLHFRTEFYIRTSCCTPKGPSLLLSVMFLFGPERTVLPVLDVFGSFPFDADVSSWLCCSLSLMSTSPPDVGPLPFYLPCILAFSKLCILGLGMGTFPDVTVFDENSLF